MEIAVSWRHRFSMRSCSPVTKGLNHLLSVGYNVIACCALFLQTDFDMAPPKAVSIKTFAFTDCTFLDVFFQLMADRSVTETGYPNSDTNPPIVVRR